MTLKNLLYNITDSDREQQAFRISFVHDNLIYRAHFPEMPITPGVCIIQIAVELLSDLLEMPVELESVHNAKFITVINPLETASVVYQFKKIVRDEASGVYKVTADVTNDGITYTKLSLIVK